MIMIPNTLPLGTVSVMDWLPQNPDLKNACLREFLFFFFLLQKQDSSGLLHSTVVNSVSVSGFSKNISHIVKSLKIKSFILLGDLESLLSITCL